MPISKIPPRLIIAAIVLAGIIALSPALTLQGLVHVLPN